MFIRRATKQVVGGVVLTLLPSVALAQTAEPSDDDALAPSTVQYGNQPMQPAQPATPTETTTPTSTQAPAVASPAPKPDEPPAGRTANNAIWAELLGNGVIYSINYERIFGESVGLRVGFSYLPVSGSSYPRGSDVIESTKVTLLTFPVLLNYYGVGSRNHKLQLGAGLTFAYASSTTDAFGTNGSAVIFTASIGYRYMPADGGFNFYIGFTPLFHPKGDPPVLPLPGLGLGVIF